MNQFKLPDCKHTPKDFPYGTAVQLEPRVPTCSFCEAEAKDAKIAVLLSEVERLRAALNSDRTGLAAGLVAVLDRCKGGWWITEGRGSYEWDDERYRDETRIAFEAVMQIATLALRESGALVTATFNGPLDEALLAKREGG